MPTVEALRDRIVALEKFRATVMTLTASCWQAEGLLLWDAGQGRVAPTGGIAHHLDDGALRSVPPAALRRLRPPH